MGLPFGHLPRRPSQLHSTPAAVHCSSDSATDAASPPLISAISATGLAATVRGLRVGLALVGVQGRSVERAGFDAARPPSPN